MGSFDRPLRPAGFLVSIGRQRGWGIGADARLCRLRIDRPHAENKTHLPVGFQVTPPQSSAVGVISLTAHNGRLHARPQS